MSKIKHAKKAEVKKPKVVGFNIMTGGATANAAVRETLERSSKRLYKCFAGDPNKSRLVIPIPEFPLALALRSRGFVSGTVFQVIGPEGIGKTTLMFTIMGWFIRNNSACWYGESENKPMMEARIERCLHWDRTIAKAMRETIYMEPIREIRDWFNKMLAWVQLRRDKTKSETYVPLEIPLMLGTDTFSKLLSPAEAQGFLEYLSMEAKPAKPGKKESKAAQEKREKLEAPKELGTGSNFQHAKLVQEIMRKVPHLLGYYNCFLMVNCHQNDKIDMSAGHGGGSLVPADVVDNYNTTTIGGRGFKQSSAYQMIIGRKGFEKGTINGQPDKVGVNLYLNVSKNSFGPVGACNYRLMMKAREDTETVQEMALNFNSGLVDALAATGLLKITAANKNNITCKELGVEGVSLHKFAEAFYNAPEVVQSLMERMEFVGCEAGTKFPELNPAFLASSEDVEEEKFSESQAESDKSEVLADQADPPSMPQQ